MGDGKKQNILQRIITRVDPYQRAHKVTGLGFAIVKKYGDDNGGYQAALLTYYSFLSLFPLLLVMTTVAQIWFKNNATLHHDILHSIDNYFPLLGNQLQDNIHTMHRTGLGLIIGLLLTFYGARGAADALRFALDNVWHVPKNTRPGFPKSILQSLLIMLGTFLGFIATVCVASFSAGFGHAVWVKIAVNVLGFAIAFGTILFIFSQATARNVPVRDMIAGSAIAAFLLQILLTFGSLLVAHELKGLNSVYGIFAIVLGLLFWLYILSQVVIYAAEFDSVRHLRLWPRAIDGSNPTPADERAMRFHQSDLEID